MGLPGTGLFYTSYSPTHARAAARATATATAPSGGSPTGRASASGSATVAPAPPAPPPARVGLTELTPPQKIATGLLLTLLVITAPVGLWLLVLGLRQLRQPAWRARAYVRQANLEPHNAPALLASAEALVPESPEVLGPLAELRLRQGDNAAALDLFTRYCKQVPDDWVARGHLAVAALNAGQLELATSTFALVREHAPLTPDSAASVTAHLAYAFLCEGDAQQALALTSTPARRAAAGAEGAQQCLFYASVSHYMLGAKDRAIAGLDRLYAVNPSYGGLQAAKDAMTAGTYELLLPGGQSLTPAPSGASPERHGPVVAAARLLHCPQCQAPLPHGASRCDYCHAPLGSS